MRTNKGIAVRLARVALRISSAEELGRGVLYLIKKFHPRLPVSVVAGEGKFVVEGFAVGPLPAVLGIC